jgi:hypothetical protein
MNEGETGRKGKRKERRLERPEERRVRQGGKREAERMKGETGGRREKH